MTVYVIKSQICQKVVIIFLLSVSLMAKTTGNEKDITNAESIAYNASTHAKYFKEIFSDIYTLELKEWAITQTADNCNDNTKIAK